MRDAFLDVSSIAAGKRVSYVYADGFEAPAGTVEKNGAYIVAINRKFLEAIKDPALRLAVEKGLRVHENAEICWGSIEVWKNSIERKGPGVNRAFYKALSNLIDDTRIELCVEKSFPAFSKYLSLTLSHMSRLKIEDKEVKEKSELDAAIEEIMKKAKIKVNPKLLESFHVLYQATRFGEVEKKLLNKDMREDLRFMVPRVFLARRGKLEGTMQATDEIYAYLDKKYGIPPELRIETVYTFSTSCSSSGEGEGSETCNRDGNGASGGEKRSTVQVIPWKNRKTVEANASKAVGEAEEQLERAERTGGTGGLLGAPDHVQLVPPTLEDVEFYLNTVSKHDETIRRLANLFSRIAGKRWFIPSREGELNINPAILMQAYVDSFNGQGDERNYYLVMRYSIPDADVCLVKDESGSVYSSSKLFAEATVVLMEAIKRVSKIRTAAVGFGDGIRILKDFYERIEEARFHEQSGGGTPTAEALKQALALRWRRSRQAKKLLVLLTDGFPDSWEKVDEVLPKLDEAGMIKVALCVGVEANEDYKARFNRIYEVKMPEDLPNALFNVFLENTLITR